jgi:type I restriction enzyme R subunit
VVRLPDRTRSIAEDLWEQLCRNGLQNEKTIIFCVDDTHAALMAQEMRRVASDDQYAARITRSERNSHQLERNFGAIGRSKPRVAVTVDLLTTGFDAPDVKNIVFARTLRSAILYKQMKGRGTRLCEDIDKRFFTIWDYVGASKLEDAEFDGHPANIQNISSLIRRQSAGNQAATPSAPAQPKPVGENVTVFISSTERYVCLADGRKIQFDEYCEQSKEFIREVSTAAPQELLKLWIDRNSRRELREELKDRDIHVAAFRHYFDLADADDVDILTKVGFDLARVPFRRDRVVRFWQDDEAWLMSHVGQEEQEFKMNFWQACLDHYSLYGVDEIEQGQTYNAPQFTRLFGNFSELSQKYGGGQTLRTDLEQVKRHLYVPMMP